MNIATVAMDSVWKDIDANISLTEQHVARVMEIFPKTDIILFPERDALAVVIRIWLSILMALRLAQ
jgi:hypothetical protein